MNEKMIKLDVGADLAGERLDVALAKLISDSSRSFLQKAVKSGALKVNGAVETSPRRKMAEGDVLELAMPEAAEAAPLVAEEFAFPILFEDEHMMIIDKPAGVVVHPAPGNYSGTVVNALLGRFPELAESLDEFANRPGIVHRLDKDTSGCLVVAKNPTAQFKLSAAFAGHKVQKTYLALVRGEVREKSGRIESMIGRHPVNRQKMAVVRRNGKLAITLFRKIDSAIQGKQPFTLLEVDILTGRTHQIRVHCSDMGHPVIGDDTYGGICSDIPAARQLLHAWRISLPHPVSGEILTFTAPVPEDMATLLCTLRKGAAYVS